MVDKLTVINRVGTKNVPTLQTEKFKIGLKGKEKI